MNFNDTQLQKYITSINTKSTSNICILTQSIKNLIVSINATDVAFIFLNKSHVALRILFYIVRFMPHLKF